MNECTCVESVSWMVDCWVHDVGGCELIIDIKSNKRYKYVPTYNA